VQGAAVEGDGQSGLLGVGFGADLDH
jgi:hypothetical protein